MFHLNFRPPYDWERLLEFFGAHATPGVEAVAGGRFCRSICVGENRGYMEVSLDAGRNALKANLQIGEPCLLFFIIKRIRAMFDVDADCGTIARTLGADPLLAPYVRSHPGMRVPGCWNGFELATRAIVREQLTYERADALAGRMVKAFGRPFFLAPSLTHLFPTSEALDGADLISIGVEPSKAETIRALARAVRNGQIRFEKVPDATPLCTRLREIPGISESITQWVTMRSVREPDAFPSADRGLARVLAVDGSKELEQRSQLWRPWRAYAAMYLRMFAGEIRARRNTPAPSANKNLLAGKVVARSRITVAERGTSNGGNPA